MIVLAPEEFQAQTVSVEVQERLKAGKKRARKIRQRLSTGLRDQESVSLFVTGTNSRHQSRYS